MNVYRYLKHATSIAIVAVLSVVNLPAYALTLTEAGKLLASDGARSDFFGVSVALDGDIAAIGAFNDDGGGFTRNGSAYVFNLIPDTDSDEDLVPDSNDNCPTVLNAVQADFDSDGLVAIGSENW